MTTQVTGVPRTDRARRDDPWTGQDTVTATANWTGTILPALNTAVRAKRAPLSLLLQEVAAQVANLVGHVSDTSSTMTESAARRILRVAGFLVTSIEHHTQAAGDRPGEGLAHLPGAEAALLRLGQVAGQPPRDNHHTLWLSNRGRPPLSFTGDPQELFFHNSVLEVDHLNQESAEQIVPIATGEVPIDSEEAVGRLRLSEHLMQDLHTTYHRFLEVDPQIGRQRITPEFFAVHFRTWLVSYPVGGVDWTGPNAANVASQMIHDLAIGTTDTWYEGVINDRLRHQTREDRASLEEALNRPSVASRFLQRAGLDPNQLTTMSAREVNTRIASMASPLRKTGEALARTYLAAGKASAAHWALIVSYLERFSASLPSTAREALTVRPSHGTGGMGHGDTKRIMELRRAHPVVGRLANVFTNDAHGRDPLVRVH